MGVLVEQGRGQHGGALKRLPHQFNVVLVERARKVEVARVAGLERQPPFAGYALLGQRKVLRPESPILIHVAEDLRYPLEPRVRT